MQECPGFQLRVGEGVDATKLRVWTSPQSVESLAPFRQDTHDSGHT